MNALRIQGRDVKAGDVLLFLGVAHLITAIEPIPHHLDEGEAARIAFGADEGWVITLIPDGWYDVVPGR